jgi:nucleotide-binding universal stress UspA family protein
VTDLAIAADLCHTSPSARPGVIVDGSDPSLHALDWALRRARDLHVGYKVLSAYDPADDSRAGHPVDSEAAVRGSVTEECMRHAPCPVAVVPGTER